MAMLAVTWLSFALLSDTQSIAREWKDATGKYRIKAELVAVRRDKVVLERESGEIISVPLSQLCQEDQDFLK